MAELTPLYMDISNVYSGDDLGLPWRDIIGEGVVGAGDLAVTQNGSGADLSVDVAAGACWVLGDTNPAAQPCYRCRNDATVNLGISPDASNPRKVVIAAQITDETFADTGRNWALVAIHGTPAASPLEPALPDSALKLAVITVPAAASSIVNANITDSRRRASIGSGGALAPGSELAYSQITAGVNLGLSSALIIPGVATEYDGSPVIAELYCPQVILPSVAQGTASLLLDDGATQQVFFTFLDNPAAATMKVPVLARVRFTPTPGTHTFDVYGNASSTTGTPSVQAGSGTVTTGLPPGYLRITKV